MPSICIYADAFSKKGKGPRLATLASTLPSGRFKFYCRSLNNKNEDLKNLFSFPGNGLPLKLMGMAHRYSPSVFHGLWDRNRQEDLFDLWCSKVVSSGLTIAMPSMHRTVKRASSQGTAAVMGFCCSPKFIKSKIKDATIILEESGVKPDFAFYVKECEKVSKTLDFEPNLICASEAVAKTYREYDGYDVKKIDFLTDWLALDQRKPQSKPCLGPRFGFVGNLSALKGIPLLIDLFCKELSSESLLLFGELFRDTSKVLSQAVNNPKCRIKYCGYGNKDDISRSLDCVIVPSFWDAEPRVVREFLKAGLYVIAPEHITSISHPNLFKYTVHNITDYRSNLLSVLVEFCEKFRTQSFEFANCVNNFESSVDFDKELCERILRLAGRDDD